MNEEDINRLKEKLNGDINKHFLQMNLLSVELLKVLSGKDVTQCIISLSMVLKYFKDKDIEMNKENNVDIISRHYDIDTFCNEYKKDFHSMIDKASIHVKIKKNETTKSK